MYDFKFIALSNGMVKIEILQVDKEVSLYKFLKELKFSEAYLGKLRKNLNNVLINKKPSRVVDIVRNNDIIMLKADFENGSIDGIMQTNNTLDIVFEDEFFLIINKPSQLASIPTKSHYSDNLVGRVLQYYKKHPLSKSQILSMPRLLNRLDFDTAGIVVIAKNLFICSLITKCNFQKTYYALCEGFCDKNLKINKQVLTLKDKLGINIRKRVVGKISDEVSTSAIPILQSKKNNLTLFEVKLMSGKTHQIRVHLSSVGFPLLGDKLYGEEFTENLTEKDFSHKTAIIEKSGSKENIFPAISHTALCCKKITFFHPLQKKQIELEVELEKDFQNIINKYFNKKIK